MVRVLTLIMQELLFSERIRKKGARILKQDIFVRNPGSQHLKIKWDRKESASIEGDSPIRFKRTNRAKGDAFTGNF